MPEYISISPPPSEYYDLLLRKMEKEKRKKEACEKRLKLRNKENAAGSKYDVNGQSFTSKHFKNKHVNIQKNFWILKLFQLQL